MKITNGLSLIFCFIITLNTQAQNTNIAKAGNEAYPSPRVVKEVVGLEEYNAKNPPFQYQQPNNSYYWKNKSPKAGYWQQDVHYTIQATIKEDSNLINATETLEYWNNSPDTLTYVFFHLYQNAFQPNSYLDKLNSANSFNAKWGNNYESKGLGTNVLNWQANGMPLQVEYDNTIAKIFLQQPLLPNSKISFQINFKTYWDNGNQRRRMKWFDVLGHKNENGYRHYDGVHWYPRIAVYDAKFGWDVQQHLGKEFYGDYGTFDVSLNFASNYIVEATGWLQNKEEVLPKQLLEKLNLKNFENVPSGQAPSTIIAYTPSSRKTWSYHADNVHDFAFTADPSYRISETYWNGIQIVALAQEGNAAGWQNAAAYTAKVIAYYSKTVGMYGYPKMVVADAQDGMEYPMLTLDGGTDPGYRDLLAHEVGHNWFFGMVGNNETYRAMLDEGFTQFLNTNACEAIDGPYRVQPLPKNKYVRRFFNIDTWRNSETYNGFMTDAVKRDATTINTHSDDFNSALGHNGGYRNVYYKTSAMLFNLQYVLGDSLFWGGFNHYFNQWKFCHPYPDDFRQSFIQYTKVDLNWFFDQWIETAKGIDYSIDYHMNKNNNYTVELKRKGEMQMPIDFTITDNAGVEHKYHVPNTWFIKKTDATILPKWTGWGKLNTIYTTTINLPSGIEKIAIDPSHRLADRDMQDNQNFGGVNWLFDSQINQPNDWTKKQMRWRPEFWWNNVDGLKPGIHFNGHFMKYFNIFNATIWFNTGLLQQFTLSRKLSSQSSHLFSKAASRIVLKDYINYNIDYKTATDGFLKNSSIEFHAQTLEGLTMHKLQFNFPSVNNTKFFINIKAMHWYSKLYTENFTRWGSFNYLNQYEFSDMKNSRYDYSVVKIFLPNNQYNYTLNGGAEKNYSWLRSAGNVKFVQRLGYTSSDTKTWQPYTTSQLTLTNAWLVNKLAIKTRIFAQASAGFVPNESAVYMAGANAEEMADNKFTRASGWLPYGWQGFGESTGNTQIGGGLNLRGYTGYLANEVERLPNNFSISPTLYLLHKGRHGLAANVEVDFDDYVKFKPTWFKKWLKVDIYTFADAGLISFDIGANGSSAVAFAPVRVDAGIGTAFTIKRWWVLEQVKPLTLRFDMPLFLNHPPAAQNYFQFRWVVGISRAF
jgi:hypothetical protein